MTTTAPPSADESATVALPDIERTLAHQLQAVQAQETAGSGDPRRALPVRRACMSNLVIYCDRKELAQSITSQVPAIVALHPARVLLLVGDAAAEASDVTASVAVRTRKVGAGRTLCFEQITLHGNGRAIHRLPYVVRGLLIGDLPTNLWWASPQPPPLAGPLLYDLAEPAQQVIYDSLGWPEPAVGVSATAAWIEQCVREGRPGRWRVVSDLNWRRLKYWRRLLAQALDPASAPGVLESVAELLVEHGPHAIIQAWLIASWLTSRLGWRVQTGQVQPGVEITWQLLGPHHPIRVRIRRLAESPPELRRIHIACTPESQRGALNVVVQDDCRLAAAPEGGDAAPRTITVRPQGLPELVGRQLSDRERDPVFVASMAVAGILAQSVAG